MDARLVSGNGHYVDDIELPNMADAAFLRSPYAHALVKQVSLEKARHRPGVLLALDATQLSARTRPLPTPIHSPRVNFRTARQFSYTYLSGTKVRYVGEPVAVVVAEDAYLAEDALEDIEVSYEPLPPALNPEEAIRPSTSRLFDDWPDNVYVDATVRAGDFDRASNNSDLVLNDRIRIHRQTPCPMETGGCVAQYDPSLGKLTFHATSQNVHELRLLLAYALKMPPSSLRVVSRDVGGGFGCKNHLFNEHVAVSVASMQLGRPVRWTESRYEHLLSGHARDQIHDIQVAVRKDGEILGLKDRVIVDLGGAILNGHGGLYTGIVTLYTLTGPYRIPNFEAELLAVMTNKAPYVAYRGYGQPEGVFAVERMIDRVARELKMDPAELRLKNMIRTEEFPYVAATGAVFDDGRFKESLEKALELIGYAEFRRAQAEARQQGRYLGIGIGCYVKSGASPTKILLPVDDPLVTSGQFPANVVAQDGARVRIEPDGRVQVFIAATSLGTAVETTYRGIVAKELAVDPANVEMYLSDTETCPDYSGVYASRSTVIGGGAIINACTKVKEKLLSIGSEMLGVPPASLEFGHGELRAHGSDQGLTLKEALRAQGGTPLEEVGYYQRPSIDLRDGRTVTMTGLYSNGADIAIVEVDPETLEIQVLRYVVVHDAGPLLHREIADGQIVGGVIQGLGGCLTEEIVYDSGGQLLTSSLMDYRLLAAPEAPTIQTHHLATASGLGLYGSRPIGESGTAAVAAAIAGAVEDALTPLSIRISETPLKSDTLFRLAKG